MTCSHFKIIGSPFYKGGIREWNCTKCSQEFIPKPHNIGSGECDHSHLPEGITVCNKCGEVIVIVTHSKPHEFHIGSGKHVEHARAERELDDWKEAYKKLIQFIGDFMWCVDLGDGSSEEDLKKQYADLRKHV